jgi:hypothetical protein
MQGNVANRSLFRNKSGARDKLRSLGGIMASSEPLLEEAYRSIDTPPARPMPPMPPNMSGIMSAPRPTPPSMPQTPPPQMPPPMQPAPQMAPQMPPAPPPMRPAPVAPPAPGLNPMAQVPGKPPGLALGGFLNDPDTQARLAANTASPEERARTNMLGIDVTQTAGTVSFDDMTADQAKKLGGEALSGSKPFRSPFTEMNVGDKAPELSAAMNQLGAALSNPNYGEVEKSRMIAAFAGGNPEAKDMNVEMAKVAKKTFGKKLNSNDKIDGLNKAITGFAIAAGTSPRASVNLANGMLVGLQEMKSTEQGRQNAAAAAANAAAKGEAGGEKSRQEYRYNAVFADAFKAALEENPDDQQAALRIATEIASGAAPLAPSAQGSGGSVTAGPNLNAEQQALVAQANEAIAAGKDPAAVRQSLEKMGVPAGAV